MRHLRALEEKLRRAVEGEVRFDAGTLAVYSTDASNYRVVPLGVVAPRHEGDVAMAVALARENAMPILPRGGGTGLGGQTCNAALVLDFSRHMTAIRSIDKAAQLAVVEPGVVQSDLNAAAAPFGLFFAPDPATKDRCTLGGMIGNNSCGAHSARWGKTTDNLEALEALLYDGTRLALGAMNDDTAARAIETGGRLGGICSALLAIRDRSGDRIRQRYPKIPRRVSGYNLDELLPERGFNLARALAGSEGTLALTLSAAVKLVPRPKRAALAALGFNDVFVAADQMPWLLEHRPDALEGFDRRLVEFGIQKRLPAATLLPQGEAFLLAELGGESEDEVRGRAEALISAARAAAGLTGARLLLEPREQQALWRLRESGLGAGATMPGQSTRTWPGAEDTAVAPALLGGYLRGFKQVLDRYQLHAATYYGHFGEGCVHCRIDFDLKSAAGIRVFRAAMNDIAALVTEFGGCMSGEHGDGIARSEFLPLTFGRELAEEFREFKRVFDPDGKMNPGNLVDPRLLDSNLRLGADYRPRAVKTHFDFTAEGGLAGAALKCVGIGKCRKTDAGAMCPSYMVTRDERHSTRGRARLLFEALGGNNLIAGGLTDEALHEALDLCLACKACKSECPAGIDMAAYKAEFLSHYHARRRRPLAAHLFGRIHELSRAAALAPTPANLLAGSALSAPFRRALGLHPGRRPPHFARRTFRSWFAHHRRANPGGKEVVLMPDTFNNFFEPEVAIAAVTVLELAGLKVSIPARDLCCGRPLYDQGMLERARRRLLDSLAALTPAIERGAFVVGLEPSCILTFRDELPAMLGADPRAKALSARSRLLDEFLSELPDFAPPPLQARVLLHGHCHQKAIAGLDSEITLLRRVEGLELDVLDAGCCGMAGQFGYEARHFDLSRAAAERVLVPAIERSAPGTIVVSDGFSCRAQIRQLCPGARPIHLAQLLAAAAPATA